MPAIRSKVIPEHILRLMPCGQRRQLGKAAMTVPEIEAKNAVKLERELQEQIGQYLRMRGITFGHSRMDRKTTYTVGWPDFSFVLKGWAVFLEAKLPGRKPDPDQEKILAALESEGAFVRVVHSVAEVVQAVHEAERTCGAV